MERSKSEKWKCYGDPRSDCNVRALLHWPRWDRKRCGDGVSASNTDTTSAADTAASSYADDYTTDPHLYASNTDLYSADTSSSTTSTSTNVDATDGLPGVYCPSVSCGHVPDTWLCNCCGLHRPFNLYKCD